jgi:hypothetical protein
VNLFAVPKEFWQLGHGGPDTPPNPDAGTDEIVLNEPLARELGVAVGDTVLLRLPQASLVPRESTLGRKSDFVEESPFRVIAILPAAGLGRFGLQPNQQLPLNAYAALSTVQRMLDQRKKANALLVSGDRAAGDPPPPTAERQLQEQLRPRLADYGVKLEQVERGDVKYFNLTTDRMMFEPPVERAALDSFAAAGAQPTLTYLANYIAAGPQPTKEEAAKLKPDDKWPNAIPYSTVTAIDLSEGRDSTGFGRWTSTLGREKQDGKNKQGENEVISRLADDEIALNSWAFDDLNKQLDANGQPPLRRGDEIRLTFFEPEHPDGQSV